MIKIIPFALSILLLLGACEQKKQADLLIWNARVIDIKKGEVTPGRLVVISGDSIKEVTGMEHREDYEGIDVLDAEGSYLMPGLWDNHVHFRGGDTLVQENKNLLPLFLAHGVTSVRDAGGDMTPSILEWREQIARHELEGPRIFTSGPKLDGPRPAWAGSIPVSNKQDIEMALDSLKGLNVDYVKMYDGSLTAKAFYEIIKTADDNGFRTTGHMPLTADFMQAVTYGLDGSEHLYYVLKACSPLADSLTREDSGYGMIDDLVESYDPNLASQIFQRLSEEEVFITPTLHIGHTLSNILEVDHSQDSLLPFVGSGIRKTYQGRIEGAKRAKASGSKMRTLMEQKSMEMIEPMFEAGVPLLAGSDCGPFNSYVYPGGSLHEELARLVDAGLTPREALITSVIHGPMFFDLGDVYGSVEKGKTADLLLLDANPLEDIRNISRVKAVIRQDKVYDKNKLERMLKEMKTNA